MKTPPIRIQIKGQTLWLSPNRSAFWEEENTLIIADLHIGKSGHFRKAGIAAPPQVFKEDIQRLFALISFYNPCKLIITGDMFHSKENKEMELFVKWRNSIPELQTILVKGNHDIVPEQLYERSNIMVEPHEFSMGHFSFVHDIESVNICEGTFVFAGHRHPGIAIKAGARQQIKLPCFYFTKNYCILPAFSLFSGMSMVRPKKGESVYAITNETVIRL